MAQMASARLGRIAGNAEERRKRRDASRAWLWIGPGFLLMGVFLIYPMLNTLLLSFFSADSTTFVGLKNYATVFTNASMLEVLWNNLRWLVIGTVFTVGLGLVIALLVDRTRVESIVKSALFVPMAISFVGAGVIWRFVYLFAPANRPQIGILNAIVVTFGGSPQAWLIDSNFNNYALMAVYIWMWTGFCVVVLSAAIKGIPEDILEAARIDGATNFTLFLRVIVPMIKSTLTVVATTMIINLMKIFDIVYVMTGGQYKTDVVAVEYYQQLFTFNNYGVASALAVILLIAILPVMYMNIRRIREEEA